jgi:diguanylate cyclase (GGDEF)-like protein
MSRMNSMRQLAAIFDACDAGLIVLAANGQVVAWNAWMQRASGVAAQAIVGQTLQQQFGDAISPRLLAGIEHALTRGMSTVLAPRVHRAPLPLYRGRAERTKENSIAQYISVQPVRGASEEPLCVVHVTDVSASLGREEALKQQTEQLRELTEELRSTERQLQHVALHDVLTGLPNRNLFNDRLKMALEQARRASGMAGVMLLDLDDFRLVNERHGQAVGDALLRAVAVRMEGCLRRTDTVARLGGNEFALILPQIEQWQAVEVLAGRLVEVMADPYHVSGQLIEVGLSIGACLFPVDAEEPEQLLRNCAVAMQECKRAHGSAWRMFSSGMREQSQRRARIEHDLRHAAARHELIVHYQPQVDLNDGHVVAVEALVRWQHPELGLIMPGEFIDVAERRGHVRAIGDFVIEEVSRARARWRALGQIMPDVSLNVSPAQFRDPQLAHKLRAAAKAAASDNRRIEIELTENLLMDDVSRAGAVLNDLRAEGVQLAIDDFGTGYSSLEYLRLFPVHKIKIDRSFVRDIENNPKDEVIAKAIISLGQSLGHLIVAEGVENPRQAEMLATHGCNVAQGYHYARPLPFIDAFNFCSMRAGPSAVAA